MSNTPTIDGATIEVIRSYLHAAAEEMRTTLIRTAFNPVIYEVLDFGISMYDRNIELIAESTGIAAFSGANDYSITKGIEYVGRENLHRGDVVLLNYPYWNGAHAYDATIFSPVFLPADLVEDEEEALIGFVCIRAHWMDLGAKDPGYVLDSTDMHQEGMIFPGTKLWDRGEPVHAIHELIRFNSRLPELVLGDMHAQVASLRTGEKRLAEVYLKFGRDQVTEAIRILADQSEARTIAALRALPQGSWVAEDYIDDDGISDDPLLLRVRVTNEDGHLTIDFTGSAPAAAGPVNMPIGGTIALGKVAMRNLTAPNDPANAGGTRPLTVIAEPGSLFHAVYPSPTFTLWTGIVAQELIYRALAQAMPDKLAASSGGDVPGFMMVGHDENGELYAISNNDPVGWGGTPDHDGMNATSHLSQATVRNTPLEVLEARSGMLFERIELRPDSGAAGKYRGGLGIRRDIRFLTDGELLSVVKKTKTRPWGLAGGEDADPISVVVHAETPDEKKIGTGRTRVAPGDLIKILSAGGGGHGDPQERDIALIQRDLEEGFVTIEGAEQSYGVTIIDGVVQPRSAKEGN